MENPLVAPERHTALLGRTAECARLEELIAAIRRGESRVLVIRGEAGIGKTELLRYLVRSASDMTVVRAAGVESEMELPYASLHLVCRPLFDRLSRLPDPQRRALEIVFSLSDGSAPDPFLVALAVLTLLSEAGEERPLLCVIDDAQWLDHASALTLAFVARRLLAEPVGVVFAARDPGAALQHIAELDVPGLRSEDARALLGSAVGFILDERVRDQLVAEAHGNPLALLELPRGLSVSQLAGGFEPPTGNSLSGRLEESFVRRLESLPQDARLLLLIAAADPVGDPLLLWRAAKELGVGSAAATCAEAEGLLTIRQGVVFRHPLVRSAAYRSAAVADRRAVHLALAAATDRETDPDRRAWHLASAAAGPDERVAHDLERSAARAQSRGGLVAAAAFLQRAVALTGDPNQQVDRALSAAEASLQAGRFDDARGLLITAEAGPIDEIQQARMELLRGRIALFSTLGGDAPLLLMNAAKRLERIDANLARDTYLDALGAASLAGSLSTGVGLADVALAARSAPRRDGPPRVTDLLLDSLAVLGTDGAAAAAPQLEEAMRTFTGEDFKAEATVRWGWLIVLVTYALWDVENNYRLLAGQIDAARRAGALGRLPNDLNSFILLCVRCGDFGRAEEAIAEANMLSETTGAGFGPFGIMMLATFRGREGEARPVIDAAKQIGLAAGQGVIVQQADWMLALLCNGLGRHEEALDASREGAKDIPEQMFVSPWAAMELLEAATKCHDPHAADLALERIVAATEFARTDSALGILARSRALVSEGEEAEGLYEEAIERLARSPLRPERARAHLLYGEWLLREQRRAAARTQLRAAFDYFTSIGMEGFAERSRVQLLLSGMKVSMQVTETSQDLSAQERQIARLAADGLSNAEIGARLFLSPRTVEWHLRKVYTKLDIRSRRELANVLPGSVSQSIPG